MLPPSRSEIASATAGSPEARALVRGGSTYPRRTVAMSSRYTTSFPPGREITLRLRSSTLSKFPDGSSVIRSAPVVMAPPGMMMLRDSRMACS